MKQRMTLIAIFAVLSSGTFAQGVNLNLYTSYAFDDRFDTYYSAGDYYQGKIKGGFQWGAGLEYQIDEYHGVELLYLRQDTEAPTEYDFGFGGSKFTTFDLGINYLMLGGMRHQSTADGKLEGNGGVMLGMIIASIKDPSPLSNYEDTATKFSWGLRLGGTYWPVDRVGIRVQAQLLSAVQAVGGGFYFGTGGIGTGVSTYSTLYQFCLGGGLVIRLADMY